MDEAELETKVEWTQWAVKSDVFDDGWFIDPSEERVRAQATLIGSEEILCRHRIDWPVDAPSRTWAMFAGAWTEAPKC